MVLTSPAVIAIITDFICSGLPITSLWNVQIKKKTKVVLFALMSMGLLYITPSCVLLTSLVPAHSNNHRVQGYSMFHLKTGTSLTPWRERPNLYILDLTTIQLGILLIVPAPDSQTTLQISAMYTFNAEKEISNDLLDSKKTLRSLQSTCH